jgi:hypothetical protein
VGSLEIIKGFTTVEQALELAQRMQLAIAEIL